MCSSTIHAFWKVLASKIPRFFWETWRRCQMHQASCTVKLPSFQRQSVTMLMKLNLKEKEALAHTCIWTGVDQPPNYLFCSSWAIRSHSLVQLRVYGWSCLRICSISQLNWLPQQFLDFYLRRSSLRGNLSEKHCHWALCNSFRED